MWSYLLFSLPVQKASPFSLFLPRRRPLVRLRADHHRRRHEQTGQVHLHHLGGKEHRRAAARQDQHRQGHRQRHCAGLESSDANCFYRDGNQSGARSSNGAWGGRRDESAWIVSQQNTMRGDVKTKPRASGDFPEQSKKQREK